MDIENASENFLKKLNKIRGLNDLKNLQIEFLGRKGFINKLIVNLKAFDINEKKRIGEQINKLKKEISNYLETKKNELIEIQDNDKNFDVTLPGINYPKGSLHPTTTTITSITKIFQKIGFTKSHYSEVEREYFAFDALNMPKGHPARDDFETFFLDASEDEKLGKLILTPHTSSGQIREMKRLGKPPIRMISIGKCYRPNWDTVHTPMFHQFEGMCVDKNISIVNLKGTIEYFVKEFFGENRETRLRPFHFQFTEPSFEVDISCGICNGTGFLMGGKIGGALDPTSSLDKLRTSRGKQDPSTNKCKVCKSGWLELGGAGMIHPNVLKNGGIDPDKYTGWAFGFGIERVYMMKEGLMLDDIRILYSGNLEFLKQF